jgi:hypothetical protein
VLGPAGALGNQSRLGSLFFLAPERLVWLRNPGALSKNGYSHFSLIRQFMAYLEGQGVICLPHMFSFIPARQS